VTSTAGYQGRLCYPPINARWRWWSLLSCRGGKKNPSRRDKKTDKGPFFDMRDQMEGLLATVDLDWPEDERADAHRRLSRLTRALRLARETREGYSG
jgi:hypothetical protein